ncbi:efflux RND transporter periplasmic adaptor subunit [Roseiarcaceae bacterium H3SJ34-1]|uniref:efflux RND transporter periplasmic adaptor subunit n=1 Tax=Terripilifer ovatus TaxID=3032367 RepID=UPI003AB91AFF|nr:efflux RND transporter periplasmic adaptor subunit [Roseiarcaceae bacterium H3SJ34-1]
MARALKWAAGLVAVLLVAGGGYYWRFVREIPVRVATPAQNVSVRVFGIGTIEAQVVSKVGFQIAGKLISIEADQGDFVKAGALLAKLDDEAQRSKLEKSEAARRQAAANLAKAQAQRERAEITYQQKKSVNARRQTLAGRGSVSQEAAEEAQAAEEIALGDVKVIEADTRVAAVLQDDANAQRRIDAVVLAQHELRAPFDARVVARTKELGGIANAGEAVFTLIAPDSIWVKAYVDEALAGGLEIGQAAVVRLRSEPDRLFETEVVRIDQENDRLTEERRVYVRCRVCNPQHQLRYLGEQAEVEIVKKVIPSGLFVPLKYIDGYDGRSGIVWTLQDGRLARQHVQLGERLIDARIQIVSDPKGQVVIDDRADLRPGRAARPQADGP